MNCSHCNQSLELTYNYCPNCGHEIGLGSIEDPASRAPFTRDMKWLLVYVYWFLIYLIVLIVIQRMILAHWLGLGADGIATFYSNFTIIMLGVELLLAGLVFYKLRNPLARRWFLVFIGLRALCVIMQMNLI